MNKAINDIGELIAKTKQTFPSDLQIFQFLNKYSRFNNELGRRETWPETCNRAITFMKGQVEKRYPGLNDTISDMWDELTNALLVADALPAMRLLQMAGPAAERCNVAVYNCAFAGITDVEYFAEVLYILMQGTGAGFSIESQFIEDLPRIRKINKHQETIPTHVIGDDAESWCDALKIGMKTWFDGNDIRFDYSKIRPAGAPLKTKGGKSSGPEPLRELLDFTRNVIFSRQGKRLRDIDVHDILCKIGKIVVAGGVRRAAMISLSDLDSVLMQEAKYGQFWYHAPQRTMANNSAVYETKPTALEFMEEWMKLAKSGTGERGIFNRGSINKQLPLRRRKINRSTVFGCNPCCEILLRWLGQFCNLSISVVRPNDTLEDLRRKVRIATIFGVIQSLMTDFNYLRPIWKQNCEEERLLGVDLLGAADNVLLQYNDSQGEILKSLQDYAIEVAAEMSALFNIAMPAAVTCIKPGGNSSVLLNTGNAITGWMCKYAIRYVRVNAIDPMAKFLIDAGIEHYPEYDDPNPEDPRVWVFGFPLKAPDNVLLSSELIDTPTGRKMRPLQSAIDQLENWKSFKINWTEHNPSVTIYVGDEEWLEVGNWVYKNWDIVCGLSFLPRDNGVYQLAPITAISEDEYNERVKNFPTIDWSKFFTYEGGIDSTTVAREYACTGDKCMI